MGKALRVSDEKTPIEQALDLLVYAPLGFAFSFRELAKQAAEKGRQQVQIAKMVGQFAVQMGQQQAEQRLKDARRQAEDVVSSFLPGGGRPSHVPPAPPAPPATGRVPAAEPVQTSAPVSEAPVTTPPGPVPDAASLAIPAYDTLSASQVVQRLAGLSAAEREAIRVYEAARRGRKTILTKIEQLG